ncbi:DUF4377 domain-containing protein [uncultured Gelidibacter sp.]|uniref:DUF4377 domain-containing protein n=1 Tax=uncultured Gelidibacter sp. TaxID=259318 RepID=UPI0026160FD7|nr:DUF4377 domain-containing protein [uncultured Gelidibacter sp.]
MKVRLASVVLVFSFLWFTSCQLLSSEKIIYVKNASVACADDASQKCLQIKTSEDAPWTNFSGTIDGFDYEEGNFYKLKVSVSSAENTSAEAPQPSYTLVRIEEQTKTPLTLDNGFWIVVDILDQTRLPRNPVFSISENQIKGNTSCNKFLGSLELDAKKFKTSIAKTTDMGCKTNEVEYLFVENLPHVKRYKIKGDSLLLMDKHNKKIMACVYAHD